MMAHENDEVINISFKKSELICPICLDPLASPISLNCGHCFDRECIILTLDSGGNVCPICRTGEIKDEVRMASSCSVLSKICRIVFNDEHTTLRFRNHEKLRLKRVLASTSAEEHDDEKGRASNSADTVAIGGTGWLYLPWNAVYGPSGVHSEADVPDSITLNTSIVAIIFSFLVLSFFLDKFLKHIV